MGMWGFISWLLRMGYVSDVAVSHFDPECRSLGTMPMAAMSVLISLSACHLKMTRMSCSSWWLCDSVCHCTIRSRAPHLIKREGSVTLLLGVQSWLFTYSCWSRVTLTSTIGTNAGLARSSAAPILSSEWCTYDILTMFSFSHHSESFSFVILLSIAALRNFCSSFNLTLAIFQRHSDLFLWIQLYSPSWHNRVPFPKRKAGSVPTPLKQWGVSKVG